MWWLLARLALAVGPSSEQDAAFLAWSEGAVKDEPRPEVSAGYHFSGDVFRTIAEAIAARPGLIEPELIGRSAQGRPIWAFHVQDPADGPPTRSVLVFGGIHAMEWIATETALTFFTEIVAAPPAGVRVTVIPLLNPDGRARVQKDLEAGRNAWRRANGAGVDLNRDFAWNRDPTPVWSDVLPAYHATSPAPLSQPESQALDALVARERYDRAASLHAFGGFLYYPWAGSWARPDDWAELHTLGRVMEAAQGRHAYRPRQLARWGFFFRAHGAEIDHLYGAYGVDAFLIELTRTGTPVFQPSQYKQLFRRYNPADPAPHLTRGARALHALVAAPEPP